MAVTLRFGAVLATVARRVCADGAACAAGVTPSTATAAMAAGSVLRQSLFDIVGAPPCATSSIRILEAGGRAVSVPWRPLALRPRLAASLPFPTLWLAHRHPRGGG